jgi:F-type H+-transporting ATPase subunit delta
MAEPSTVARPYAGAAFNLAVETGTLAKWSETLAALGLVAADERVRAAAADPNLTDGQAAGLIISIFRATQRRCGEFRARARRERLALLPKSAPSSRR